MGQRPHAQYSCLLQDAVQYDGCCITYAAWNDVTHIGIVISFRLGGVCLLRMELPCVVI